MAPDGNLPLLAPFGTNVNHALSNLNQGMSYQFQVYRVIGRKPHGFRVKKGLPLLFHYHPQRFKDLFCFFRQFHLLPPLSVRVSFLTNSFLMDFISSGSSGFL